MKNRIFLFIIIINLFLIGCLTQQNTVEQNNPSLRFDGVYFIEYVANTDYYRFFENGTVINASVIGRFNNSIFNWFNENWEDSKGGYSLNDDKIIFTIDYSNEIIIEYNAIIKNNGLLMNIRSSNGTEATNIELKFRKL
jgi:hypothetical protein